jgi:predicted enzyme related to lactoylglutathione lyase
MAKKGQNVWYELMTTDTAAAQRFYTEAIGWKTKAWDEAPADQPYAFWMAGEKMVGGLMALPAEAKGAPPHWLAYTRVDDVDASTQQAVKLGGKVVHGPFDVPKVGRMAILSDPQGAVFAVFKDVEDKPLSAPEGLGEFSWSELNTTDYEAAWSFYSQLFGWEHRETMDMGPELGKYFMWSDPDKITKGGMSNAARMMKFPPHWMHYVNVDDVPAAIARIKSKGGKVLNGPETIPDGGVIAQCMDPQGGAFALYAHGKK